MEDEFIHIEDTTTTDQIERGEVEAKLPPSTAVGSPNRAMRRSWKRGGEPGAYDFKFQTKAEDDGTSATVFCVFPKDKAVAESMRDTITDLADRAQKMSAALETDAKRVGQPLQPGEAPVSLERLLSDTKTVEAVNDELKALQLSAGQTLVNECVVLWKGAPVEFSWEARADLPDEIYIEWLAEILNRSNLTKKEQVFLSTISPVGPPEGT